MFLVHCIGKSKMLNNEIFTLVDKKFNIRNVFKNYYFNENKIHLGSFYITNNIAHLVVKNNNAKLDNAIIMEDCLNNLCKDIVANRYLFNYKEIRMQKENFNIIYVKWNNIEFSINMFVFL